MQTCTISYTFIVHSKFPDTGSLYLLKLFLASRSKDHKYSMNQVHLSITLYSYKYMHVVLYGVIDKDKEARKLQPSLQHNDSMLLKRSTLRDS